MEFNERSPEIELSVSLASIDVLRRARAHEGK